MSHIFMKSVLADISDQLSRYEMVLGHFLSSSDASAPTTPPTPASTLYTVLTEKTTQLRQNLSEQMSLLNQHHPPGIPCDSETVAFLIVAFQYSGKIKLPGIVYDINRAYQYAKTFPDAKITLVTDLDPEVCSITKKITNDPSVTFVNNLVTQYDFLMIFRSFVLSGDRLIFFYSGHGGNTSKLSKLEKLSRPELIVIPSTDERYVNTVTDHNIRELLQAFMTPRKQLVCILDACHTSDLFGLPCHMTDKFDWRTSGVISSYNSPTSEYCAGRILMISNYREMHDTEGLPFGGVLTACVFTYLTFLINQNFRPREVYITIPEVVTTNIYEFNRWLFRNVRRGTGKHRQHPYFHANTPIDSIFAWLLH